MQWFAFRWLASAALLAQGTIAALPPGYDDELYCPPGKCLRPKKLEPGFVGPRAAFHECVMEEPVEDYEEFRQSIESPRPWGENLGEQVKLDLLDEGFHQSRCRQPSQGTHPSEQAEMEGHAAEEMEEHADEAAIDPPVPVSCSRQDGTRPSVHAAFYLWYGNPEFDGRWLHWDHKVLPHWDKVEDANHEKFNWRPPEEPHSPFYPARGTYSSRDNATLEAQFKELYHAGVDSAMCSWWGRKDWEGKRDDADSGANTDELIPSVLEAAALAGVGVSFHIEPYGGRSPETFLEDLAYINEQYGRHPGVYREPPSNKMIFWLYDVSAQHSKEDVGRWRKALDSVRGTQLDAIFLCLWIGGKHHDDTSFVVDGGFDGAYTYFAAEGFTPGSNTKSWGETARKLKALGKLFVPAVGPGYDDTRVRPWNKHNVRDRKNGRYYDRMWQAAVDSEALAVSITSYNEWGEGTQIEPAQKYRSPSGLPYRDYGRYTEPDVYLQKTREWSDNYKTSQCQASGRGQEL